MATSDIYTIMGGLYPLKQGCRFLGGAVDDQIQINASGAAMANASYYGTLAAWICVPDDTGTYTILSYGDDNVVEYITLDAVAGKLRAICCDNTTVQWSYISTNVVLEKHKLHHVAVTQDGQNPKLYVDGTEVAVTRTTDTLPSAWFKACAGIDAGSIGAFEGNGDTSLTQEFTGYISDVAVWSSASSTAAALSAAEIKNAMTSPASVRSTLLLNYWPLDSDALDHGTGADNGTIVGDIIYCTANEFASRFTFGAGTALVADKVLVGMNNTHGLGYVIQAA